MSKFFLKDDILIEACENFQKQSFRNRTEILSANGRLSLFIPLIKGKDQKTIIRDIKIDYNTNWQKQHSKSIESAYNSSPFYEYIISDFSFVFEKQEKYLFDLNLKIIDVLNEYLQFNKDIKFTSEYIPIVKNDLRNSIHPKAKMQQKDKLFIDKKYYQTFNDKYSFEHNLSILDLLFNEGAHSVSIIKKCILQSI